MGTEFAAAITYRQENSKTDTRFNKLYEIKKPSPVLSAREGYNLTDEVSVLRWLDSQFFFFALEVSLANNLYNATQSIVLVWITLDHGRPNEIQSNTCIFHSFPWCTKKCEKIIATFIEMCRFLRAMTMHCPLTVSLKVFNHPPFLGQLFSVVFRMTGSSKEITRALTLFYVFYIPLHLPVDICLRSKFKSKGACTGDVKCITNRSAFVFMLLIINIFLEIMRFNSVPFPRCYRQPLTSIVYRLVAGSLVAARWCLLTCLITLTLCSASMCSCITDGWAVGHSSHLLLQRS